MKNTFKVLGIVALVAVIGFSFASCGGGGGEADPELNGTWTNYSDVLVLNNGNFEFTDGGDPLAKGKYTTSENYYVTITVTQLYGTSVGYQGFDAKWYSRNDAKAVIMKYYPSATNAQIEAWLNDYFISESGTYVISGSTVTFSGFTYFYGTFTKN